MEDYEKLLDEICSLAMHARLANRFSAVVELLHVYLQHRPRHGLMWFQFGDALRIVGLKDEAERALNSALANCPEKRASILTRLAQLYDAAGRHAEAEAAFAGACSDSEYGRRGWVWILRGSNLAASTQLAAAEKCYRHALTLDDENTDRDEGLLNLGYVLRAQGRYAEANEAFKSALNITPDYAEAIEAIASLEGIELAIQKVKDLAKLLPPP